MNPTIDMLRPLLIVWALPNTILGLCWGCVGVAFGGRMQSRQGVLEFYGPGVAWLMQRLLPNGDFAAAVTLGHVVLGRTSATLERCRSHELIHVRQYERWGPLFIPVYFGWYWYLRLRNLDPYLDHPFEIEAFAKEKNL